MISAMRTSVMRVMSASVTKWSEWSKIQNALIMVTIITTTSLGLAVILDAENVTNNSRTFTAAIMIAPAEVWGVMFLLAGVALFIFRKNHRRAELSALAASAVFAVWGVLTVLSLGIGGLGTAPVAYLGISAFCAITALACSAEELA